MHPLKEQLTKAITARKALSAKLQELESKQASFDERVEQLKLETEAARRRKLVVADAVIGGTATEADLKAAQEALRASEWAAVSAVDLLDAATAHIERAKTERDRLEESYEKIVVRLCQSAARRAEESAYAQLREFAKTMRRRHELAALAGRLASKPNNRIEPIPFSSPGDGLLRKPKNDAEGLHRMLLDQNVSPGNFAKIGQEEFSEAGLLAIDLGDDAEEGPSAA